MRQQIPAPPEAGTVNGLRFGTDTFRFLEGVQSRYGEAVRIPLPGRAPLVVVTDPELVHDALSRPAEFPRVPAGDAAAMIAERSLVQSEGDLWEQQRSIVGPSFSGRQVRAYADTAGGRVETLADEWLAATADGPVERDLHREMTSLTVRVASEVLLGEDIGRAGAEQFHEWMATAGAEFEFGIDTVAPSWLPIPTSETFREAADGVRGMAEEMIERRRAALAGGDGEGDGSGAVDDGAPDMLTLLLRAESNPGVEFPDNQIRDEVATFLIAGHETTALSLTYTLCLLSEHPSIRADVRREAERVLGDGQPTYDDVADLDVTERVYREAIRLYPPAWAVFRQAAGDVRLGDYVVPEGSAVVFPQWSIHRDGRYFEAPGRFDPDRWTGRDPNATPAYFPFGTGPHACIGRQFALSGATLAVARLVRAFDVDTAAGALDDLQASVTLRPRAEEGVPATVRRVE